MRLRSFAALTALAVASTPFLAHPAQAADTTLGQTFSAPSSCNTASGGGNLYLQTAPSSYSAPAAGVITSWTAQTSAPFSAALRVGRASDGGSYTIVGKGDVAQVTPDARVAARVPVRAGDVIGLYYPRQDASFACGREATSSYEFAYAFGDAAEVDPADSGFQLNVSATLEPDADGDGFGDTTQDGCSTDATTQGACPDTTAPQTTITKVKAAKVKATASNKAKAQVTVTFRASERSTFRCSVDGGRYKACSSPFKVKLAKGRHTIAVQATDAAGNVDKTPATAKVTVKRAKK